MHEHIGASVGQSDGDKILDRSVHACLGPHTVLHAKYVDNNLALGHDPHTVEVSSNSLNNKLDQIGLKHTRELCR